MIALTFDNLGEAAEIQLGAEPDERGRHFSVTEVLPRLLDALAERELRATFFVEGLNAELYPDALREIAGRGHEVGYHAWCHEEWGALDGEAQADNLRRGAEAFEKLELRARVPPARRRAGRRGRARARAARLRLRLAGGRRARRRRRRPDAVPLAPRRRLLGPPQLRRAARVRRPRGGRRELRRRGRARDRGRRLRPADHAPVPVGGPG